MKTLVIMAMILVHSIAAAQPKDNDLRISILTCEPGQEIYAAFGHCAFRATSKSKRFDKVYNYGTFNYNQPLFVVKFVRGFLDYAVSSYDYRIFRLEYVREKRKVREQVLNLSPEQAQAVYDFLEWNSMEKNRYYKYNFLEDNCATRIRDVLANACGPDIQYPDTTYSFTLRDAIDERIEDMPWFRFGITMLMGLPVDKKATARTAMFLPDYVHSTIENTTITLGGAPVPIVKDSSVVVAVEKPVSHVDFLTYCSPALLLWLLLAAWGYATYKEIKDGTYHAAPDKALLTAVGLLGMLFVVMWFFTEHTVTANNLNLIWAIPLHAAAAWAVKSKSAMWKAYYKATSVMTAVMLVCAPIVPQHYDPAFYPLLATLAMRLARIGWRNE